MNARAFGWSFAGIVLAALIGGASAAPAFHRVKGAAMASLLTGHEFTDEVHSAFQFEKGGVLRVFAFGKSKSGVWHVSGEELCLDRDDDGDQCFEVWVAGNRMELRREAAPPEEGILRRSISRR